MMRRLLTLQEAAEYMAMSESNLRQIVARSRLLRKQGKADPYGIDYFQRLQAGMIKFTQEQLDDFIKRNSVYRLEQSVQPRRYKNKTEETKHLDHGGNWE